MLQEQNHSVQELLFSRKKTQSEIQWIVPLGHEACNSWYPTHYSSKGKEAQSLSQQRASSLVIDASWTA